MNCGGCTLCCKLLQVDEFNSGIEETCRNCDTGKGCKIYKERPEVCSTYKCMWLQMENVGVELRPDKSHIIFDKISDNVISSRLAKNKKMNEFVVGQIKAFNKEGFSVMVFRGDEYKCFLTLGHTEKYVKGVLSDSAKLHRRFIRRNTR